MIWTCTYKWSVWGARRRAVSQSALGSQAKGCFNLPESARGNLPFLTTVLLCMSKARSRGRKAGFGLRIRGWHCPVWCGNGGGFTVPCSLGILGRTAFLDCKGLWGEWGRASTSGPHMQAKQCRFISIYCRLGQDTIRFVICASLGRASRGGSRGQ